MHRKSSKRPAPTYAPAIALLAAGKLAFHFSHYWCNWSQILKVEEINGVTWVTEVEVTPVPGHRLNTDIRRHCTSLDERGRDSITDVDPRIARGETTPPLL
jgi:hypothetical protein